MCIGNRLSLARLHHGCAGPKGVGVTEVKGTGTTGLLGLEPPPDGRDGGPPGKPGRNPGIGSNGVGWEHMRHSAPLSNPVGSALFTGSFIANAYGLVVTAVRGMRSGSRLKNRPITGSYRRAPSCERPSAANASPRFHCSLLYLAE
jgi:hypothetical protein